MDCPRSEMDCCRKAAAAPLWKVSWGSEWTVTPIMYFLLFGLETVSKFKNEHKGKYSCSGGWHQAFTWYSLELSLEVFNEDQEEQCHDFHQVLGSTLFPHLKMIDLSHVAETWCQIASHCPIWLKARSTYFNMVLSETSLTPLTLLHIVFWTDRLWFSESLTL